LGHYSANSLFDGFRHIKTSVVENQDYNMKIIFSMLVENYLCNAE